MPLTEQNIERPYRGMQTFSELHKDLFFGRAKPVNEIFSLLKNNLLTVIFGKSGIGKSSLINAGLVPKLRENFYLPVLVRIPFSDAAIDPLAYTYACIEAEVKKYIYKDFSYPANTTLWQFFREANYTGGAVIPVLIFDQFEEYFNFGKQNKQRSEKFIQELSDLIENRMPAELANTNSYKILATADTQNILRIIISLREDFLAPLEDISKLIPSLNKVRYRILQLHGEEAFDAVYLPAKNLIENETAIHLLKKIIPKKIEAEAGDNTQNTNEDDWKDKDFEPYILSLFCYQVNEKRIAAKQNKISEALINQTKVETILSDYYISSIKKYWRRYHKKFGPVIEHNLISDEGYRLLKPVNAKEFKNISPQAINDMVDDRIIHRENRNDVSYIEISHDLLAKVVYEKRQASKTSKRSIIAAAVFIAIIAGLFLLGYYQQKQNLEKVNTTLKAYDSTIKKQDSITTKDSLRISSLHTQIAQIVTGDTVNTQKAGTVYMQVNLTYVPQEVAQCMQALKKLNLIVPSVDKNKETKPAVNLIKYYHAEDEATAELIKTVCDTYYVQPFTIQNIPSLARRVKTGVVEVWVYYKPGENTPDSAYRKKVINE